MPTDDLAVATIAAKFNSTKIRIIDRPAELAASSTLTDDLIKYLPDILPYGHILWTHVPSPFIGSGSYDQVIRTYLENQEGFESLLAVAKVQKFIWSDGPPMNYDRRKEKWPRTQTLRPVWEVNSGAFINCRDVYGKFSDRIGQRPYFFELDSKRAFDIDWLPDFEMTELIYKLTGKNES